MSSTNRARALRRNATEAERRLWRHLRDRQLDGAKFRRQQPLGTYVADFFFLEQGLVIELDGGQHASQVERDEARTAWLNAQGLHVLRFWNNDVLGNTEGVVEAIRETLRP